MRSTHDVILTSSRTIKIDNPFLNCRIKGLEKASPVKIILDKNLSISIKSNVIKNSSNNKTIIFRFDNVGSPTKFGSDNR